MTNCAIFVLDKKNHFVILFFVEFDMVRAWRIEFRVSPMVYYYCLVVVVHIACFPRGIYLLCVHLLRLNVHGVWLWHHVCELIAPHIFKLDFYFFLDWSLFFSFYDRDFFYVSAFFLLNLFLFLIFFDLLTIKLLNLYRICLESIINTWCCFGCCWWSYRVSSLFLF